LLLTATVVQAQESQEPQQPQQPQIKIGGSVYGGGNEGDVDGSTTVTIRYGQIQNVYGGARMANVGGRAFVNLDGEHGEGVMLIGSVYGGNDISGTVGTNVDPDDTDVDEVPAALTDVLRSGETQTQYPNKNAIDNSWNAFIRSSKRTGEETDENCIFVGSVFGGGNGDYTYRSVENSPETGQTTHYIYEAGNDTPIATKVTANGEAGFTEPELAKTYLELNGGCLSQVYGGGNKATVTDNTVISMNNESKGLQELFPRDKFESDAEYQEALMQQLAFLSSFTGISTFQGDYTSIDFTSSRVFGGNNKATMSILPHWNLQKGKIRDLYSGGNQGDMTNNFGLILDIPTTSNIKVENVYGGCRRADVHPAVADAALANIQLPEGMGYHFPKGYSARVCIHGGDVNNVYGGNDISGNVWGGSAVGIYTSIRGDVYGAGNGSYAYTDNKLMKDLPGYGDFYYDVNSILQKAENYSFNGEESAQALLIHRPNAERVSLRVWGRDADHPTIIGGSIYVGGNSATLKKVRVSEEMAVGELKIGSHVYANNVFLGNNGENMVRTDVLQTYAGSVTVNGTSYDYSQMVLTTDATFKEYMKGCASFIKPRVVFDAVKNGDPDTYEAYTTYFGSFFCGGNVGSLMWPGTAELTFDREVVIFDKLVGGCNDAFVPVHHVGDVSTGAALNAEYKGGILGSEAEQATGGMTGKIKNALVLNLSGFKIEPKRWAIKRDENYDPILTADGKVTYLSTDGDDLATINAVHVGENGHSCHAYLEWNTIDRTGVEVAPQTGAVTQGYVSNKEDLDRRLQHGNVYGGCYSSGIVNGSVVINVDSVLMDPNKLFDRVAEDEQGEAILYGAGGLNDLLAQDKQNLHILERRTGVILGRQGMDVLGKALNIFGGGYGENTEIWGSTTINLNAGYVFQIFGGAEKGVIGKPNDGEQGATESVTFNGKTYQRNSLYSCTVNVRGTKVGVSKKDDSSKEMAEAEFIYGGGFLGPICGNTVINLGNGRVFNTFAGSCMADILGHTETYMGVQVDKQSVQTGEGFPFVRDYIYCGNDLGGKIWGEADFIGRVREEAFNGDKTTKSIIQAATAAHGADVTKASAYVEYRQGRAEGIFGGCFGTYDYTDPYYGEFFYATGATDLGSNAPGTAREGYTKPRMGNAFVNFRPTDTDALLIGANKYNFVNTIYGAGQGYPGDADRDIMQKSSYVLIDIPQRMTNYENMEVFGAGAWSGLGMYTYLANKTAEEIAKLTDDEKRDYYASLDKVSAITDLVRGRVGAAYGGSYKEGVTRRTMVNVPNGSTIRIGSIFGGAYGTDTYMPCDVYEGHVEYHSADAVLVCNPVRLDNNGNEIGNPLQNGAIYGGNNNERRTLYAKINIDTRVNQAHHQYGMTRGNVYGAGLGSNTWAEYTEVNLNSGAEIYEVYGGGQAGKVLNAETIQQFRTAQKPTTWPEGSVWEGEPFTDADWANAWALGGGYDHTSGSYWENSKTSLANPLVRVAEMDDRDWSLLAEEHKRLIVNRYNTNVLIHEGAYVANYGYGAGLGAEATVAGHTYIALLGGLVEKDIYAGGTSGAVEDLWKAGVYHSGSNDQGFIATANAYVEGGTVRNVYGGGWRGSIGFHKGAISETHVTDEDKDILGESHVVIGKRDGTSYINGIPSITRNVYGGGEGGAIYGTAYVKIENGYIGYRYTYKPVEKGETIAEGATYYTLANDTYTSYTAGEEITVSADNTIYQLGYKEELDDAVAGDNLLLKSGNVFGGGYVANSYTDFTDVKMFGGVVRGCLFGGGEIGPVGRGTVKNNPAADIYKAGRTVVRMYSGHVLRDVFGGGRGYDNWNGAGYMTDEEKLTMDLSSKGYVFGHTRVYIRGGEIGTDEGVAQGFGNVFGGGDRGFVYSAYEGGRGVKAGERYDGNKEGYYYKHNGSGFVTSDGTSNGEYQLTEDCKVVIGPKCEVKPDKSITLTDIYYPKKATIPPVDMLWLRAQIPDRTDFDAEGVVTAENGITIESRTYQAGDYVPTYALQTMKNKSEDAAKWVCLDDEGIIIHNAVFAGGNVSSGDDQVYANAPTVFGNATASIHDLYHRDLITIGTGHVGGLYGDGNLTFVDGYRGLNITNYGTDYHNLNHNISYEDFKNLPEREKAYYELKYKCKVACEDKQGKQYKVDDMLTYSDLLVLFDGVTIPNTNVYIIDPTTHEVNTTYWEQNGVCSIYAGRVLNTIQRADFCGVFGSRLVLQGAPDRVPETVDYTNYTINRVREVSLNKKVSIIPSDANSDQAYHGNYFGIYSIVNHLGALTSDVKMDAVRTTASTMYPANGMTYLAWKAEKPKDVRRNKANSHNMVALASGVFLELTTEKGTGKGVHEKDWGYVTGVIELDLINVQTGVGGGYVYAKNVHGSRSKTGYKNVTLTALNSDAVTRRDYAYSDDDDPNASDIVEYETSGNFVHDTQTIIDDCYDVTNSYKGNGRSPAHFWYIKGQVYVYEQYISAYTGAPSAYKESVNIPLTIAAASHGKMKLINIQPNHYAYYKKTTSHTVLGSNDELEFNGKKYGLNDPIDYWEYSLLSPAEQALFVPETYTTIAECTINGTKYPKGKVLLPSEYTALKNSVTTNNYTVHNNETNQDVDFDFIFRQTNNISHDTGYILTYDVNNPMRWNEWYTPKTGNSADDKINTETYGLSTTQQNAYYDGPTYTLTNANAGGIYGQHSYSVSNIIDAGVYNTYRTMKDSHSSLLPAGQAVFNEAYVVTVDELETQDKDNHNLKLFKGSALAQDNFTEAQWNAISGSVAPAFVSTSTIQLGGSNVIFTGDLMTEARKNELIAAAQAANNTELETVLTNSIVPAYYCTTAGLYGGNYYASGNNYRGLEAWSSMSPEDRANFTFNYDALDLLIDPNYSGTQGEKYQYDDAAATETAAEANKAQYSLQQPVDYTATFDKEQPITVTNAVTVKHINGVSEQVTTIVQGDEITRVEYEKLPNEQYHYAPISVEAAGPVYVVHEAFILGDTPYTVGQTITVETYNGLGGNQSNVTPLSFSAYDIGKTYYYCRDEYTIGHNGEGRSVKDIKTDTEYTSGTVPVGVLIAQGDANTEGTYAHLVNKQLNFTIHGVAPVETSTLYVARNSDIFDLSKEKIITVIYQYDYEESDESGMHITPVSERHIVNIHLQFKSGIPAVENITAPDLVLPGTNVVIRTPNVTPGAYEVLGGGWEIYRNAQDAENHVNGVDYSPAIDPLYWYQNGYQVAYYAKTYLGKTYSNYVPVAVANYHDLKTVMEDKEHHYYIDNSDVDRDPKIYINDYTTDATTTSQNGLELLKNLFDLSLIQRTYDDDGNPVPINSTGSPLNNHIGVETSQIGACKNLEIFLRTDLKAPEGTWTPIGNKNTDQCFEGILHGDGHTISGLSGSLFALLCGEVYNLGVTGSFTTAGIADEGTGFVENCWVKSTATATTGTKAIFNDPSDTDTRTNHIVNSYYPTTSGYTAQTGTTAKSETAFYNGEVTYDLNEFYLFKRYCDNTTPSITGNDYSFWKDVNGTLTLQSGQQSGHYASVEGPYLVNDASGNYVGSYVESRFADGDFIYAGGTIPGTADKRLYINTEPGGANSYHPIWPDDYLFFGQMLTYDHITGRAHQPLPTVINKDGDRLPNAASTVTSNRVYRAPAYYRSGTMSMAHFNPDVVLAQTNKNDATLIAHRYMTAIDFTGGNGDLASGYLRGLQNAAAASTPALPGGLPERFYPPLLDDDGIFSIQNIDLTRNLLVYTGEPGGTGTDQTPTATQQTGNVVKAYLLDQAYAETNADYHTVDVWDSSSDNVKGHWVQGSGSGYTATLDHLLVDKQDFNAPISYTFASGKRMWHQRTPSNFVDLTKGWEGISIPFSAQIVTTQTKGELTHFFKKAGSNAFTLGYDCGHEYWLREYKGLQKEGGTPLHPKDQNDEDITTAYLANFAYPAAGSNSKNYTNTFLWDYYYSQLERKDANKDIYKQYYSEAHTFSDYPYSVAGTPYLIGFPGPTYYEFDLSGVFRPINTDDDDAIAKLDLQTITFASPTGTTIDVSDNEMAETTADGYTFKPNYLGMDIPQGGFVLNGEGSSYDVTTAATTAVPFRPYFVTASGGARPTTRSIAFSQESSQLRGVDDRGNRGDESTGALGIYAKKHKIIVESSLREATDVCIVNTAGQTIAQFTIEPGQTIVTRVNTSGIFIVKPADTRFVKKLSVK
jgi:hypothetical protein